jgi:hypothetical protein
MCDVILRRVRATIFAVEKQPVLHNLCVFVALRTQHTVRMRHIVICDLPRSTIFFHITVEPRFTNASVHEQIFRSKMSRMTNGVSDYEHASWQQRQAESIGAGVSVVG